MSENDIDNLLDEANLSSHKTEIQEWYDGYIIGQEEHIYNPWDVLNHVQQLLTNPETPPQPYWVNSSNSPTEGGFLTDMQEPDVENGIAALVAGQHVVADISPWPGICSLTGCHDGARIRHIWTKLYQYGYLTRASRNVLERDGISLEYDQRALVIPNKCVLRVFQRTLALWTEARAQKSDTQALAPAFANFDAAEVENGLNNV